MSLEKKHTLWDGLCRIVQSVFLAAEITVLADLLFAAGEKPLPRAAFWGLFLAAAAALSLWRGFTRKGRRIVFLSIAGAAVLSALALFAAWSAAAPKTAYEAPETEPKAIFSEKRVLAVVPHEDDDLNLLSGVTGQFTDAGSEVYVVFVSTGDAAGLGEKRVYEAINALSLDGVPEENSLLLEEGGTVMEIPAQDLVLTQPRALLGERVHARFGAEFPIRFDFLDTVGGQNLSLQVHPLTEYIQQNFGMHYTQDESYYILDAVPESDTAVYLGVKTGVNPDEMISALAEAQQTGEFDAEKYVNRIPAKKHDHFLIPAGTVHCSGKDVMVLEISATPYIFTFKLWDWKRVGLDGRPRPIHLEHGRKNIQFDRDTEFVKKQLVNAVEEVASGDGWREERTGLHEREFIETRRHWFTKAVPHDTNGGVNVLNLVEGSAAVVESPTGAFEPFTVHYAETFIIPAAVGKYTIRPAAIGEKCATVKAYVRG